MKIIGLPSEAVTRNATDTDQTQRQKAFYTIINTATTWLGQAAFSYSLCQCENCKMQLVLARQQIAAVEVLLSVSIDAPLIERFSIEAYRGLNGNKRHAQA